MECADLSALCSSAKREGSLFRDASGDFVDRLPSAERTVHEITRKRHEHELVSHAQDARATELPSDLTNA